MTHTLPPMTECLIVTPLATEFVREVDRLSDTSIKAIPCHDETELLDNYRGHRVLFGNPGIIAPVLRRMQEVEWIQSSWAGVTPLIEHERRDYQLTGVKDVFGPQMSEYVFGYLLAHELRILERKKQQDERRWFRDHSGMLEGKTIGILGTGSIGAHVAGTAQAFGMRVLGLSRTGSPAAGFEQVLQTSQIDSFIRECDYLVSTLPQTPATDDLLNRQTLESAREGALFINVGRSNVIDDVALIAALESGRLGGAVLDVFDEEPLLDDSPLWDAPNLLVTAHISAVSHPLLLVPIFVDNYRRFISGAPLKHVIDFSAGY